MSPQIPNFGSFHCHPQSFDSGSTPEAFAEREVEMGTGTLTCSDHGTLGAARKIYDLAKANSLIPVIGCEIYFRDSNCDIIKSFGEDPKTYLKYFHATLHCLDEQAFSFLSQKISAAPTERHGGQLKPIFDWKDMEEICGHNITAGSGCLVGITQRHLIRDDLPLETRIQIADQYYQKLRGITKPGNFYAELFPHVCDRNWMSGYFLDLEGGERKRFWEKKNLRLEKLGEVKAADLVKKFAASGWKDDRLVAVMNNRKWEDVDPKTILKAEFMEGFLENECSVIAPNGDVQLGANKVVLELAQKYGDKVVVSDDSHLATSADKVVQDVRLAQSGSWKFSTSYHRQTANDSFEYFKTHMGIDEKTFCQWADNNREWSQRFKDFKFDSTPSLPTKFYPQDTLAHVKTLIDKHGRMDWKNKEYVQRLKHELDVLHSNGKLDLLPYFFMKEDIISHYQELGLLSGPGRGSAGGALISYLLGITHVDPLKHNLSFERFLTLDRIKSGRLPDIDSDFPTRDPLADPADPKAGWLWKRFGDHQAQISTSTKLKLRSCVKDVARARHGKVPEDVEVLTKKFMKPPQGIDDYDFVFGYEDSGNWVKGSIELDKSLQEYVKKYPADWEVAQRALGCTRQKGRHASAFVIADKPIPSFLPMEEVGGVPVTQYDMTDVEASGGIKVDLLIVRSLLDIQDAIKLVQQRSAKEIPEHLTLNKKKVPNLRLLPHKGQFYDIWDLPEDQDVFRDISESKTETVFQFCTSSALQWLKHFNHWKNKAEGRKTIDSIDAMAIFVSLDRPGPLDTIVEGDGLKHNTLVEYTRRARGEKPIQEIPLLTKLLPETYGILVTQEQLQRLYQECTDCSASEAEEFRSLIAKKKMAKILEKYKPWMEKVSAKYGEDMAKLVWNNIIACGNYLFNASHSTNYSYTSYACAFLKHHYPLEWWTAVLRNASKDEIGDEFWKYCGHLVDFPDVSVSGPVFEIQNERIRAPTSLLHGLGEKAHLQLMQHRPYKDIDDFCQKMEKHCIDTTKVLLDDDGKPLTKTLKKKKNQPEQTVVQTRRGHNSLTKAVCHKLILTGALDALFPPSSTNLPLNDVEKIHLFEVACSKATGKKVEPVSPKLLNLDPVTRYQMRKQILPAYSERLLPLLLETEPNIVKKKTKDGRLATYWPKERMWRGELEIENVPFKPARALAGLEELFETSPMPPGRINVALAAYIQAQRHFTYQGGKEACELILDVDGERLKFVKWPDKESGALDAKFKKDLEGSVVVALVSKYKAERPFGLDEIHVLNPAISKDLLSDKEEKQ